MLCQACRNLFTGLLVADNDEPQWALRNHHPTARDFQKAAVARCHICTELWCHFTKNGQVDLVGLQRENNITSCWISDKHHAQVNNIPESGYQLAFILDPEMVNNEPLKSDVSFPSVSVFIAQPRKDQDSDEDSIIEGEDSISSTASDSCWLRAQGWLAQCTQYHQKCKTSFVGQQGYHPTRLVEILDGSSTKLRLCITSDHPVHGPYLTLSHCWGQALFIKLTRLNVCSMIEGFAIAELPQTFQDAVLIAQKPKVRYIWIDALCILQDSEEDWRREAASMGEVYSNSLCNVAATGASSSDQGCFVSRVPMRSNPCYIKTSWTNVENHTYEVLDYFFWFKNMSRAPLNCRAWVVQERLLAPRVLHYGLTQLMWECHELDACETYPEGLPTVLRGQYSNFKGLDPDIDGKRLRIASGQKAESPLNAYHLWSKVVTSYTSGSLTKPEDKLIALSGLAKMMQQTLDDQYLAGLVRRFLPAQLLWKVDDSNQSDGRPSVRPEFYRAPSWSWAAVDGEVSGLPIDNDGILIEIVDAYTTPLSHHDPTGQVVGGLLRIRGRLLAAELYCHAQVGTLHVKVKGIELGVDSIVQPDVCADDIDEVVYCLPVRSYTYHEEPWIQGLLLRCVKDRKGCYQRYGIFSVYHEKACRIFTQDNYEEHTQRQLYDDYEKQIFEII